MTERSESRTIAIASLERLASNPIVTPRQIPFARASGAFNPGATIDRASGRVVLLVRVFEEDTRRSCLALALSSDGERIDEIRPPPAVARVEPYEEWGVEDARITYLEEEKRYAITYTGYSRDGPRVCLITTDDLLAPVRYRRHGPRIDGDNKNCVILPEKIDGEYVILHRPMPRIVCARVATSTIRGQRTASPLVGPRAGHVAELARRRRRAAATHGDRLAVALSRRDLNRRGERLLDGMVRARPEPAGDREVRVPMRPRSLPLAPYEIEMRHIPQVDMANFRTGVRVVFPQGFVERGEDFLVYYGAADVSVGGARVNKRALIDSLRAAMSAKQGAAPL